MEARLPQRLLAHLIHGLTVSARAHYEETDADRFQKLRAINEMIHVSSAKLRALLDDDPAQYPDDVFIAVLSEKAGLLCAPDLAWAFDFASSRVKV